MDPVIKDFLERFSENYHSHASIHHSYWVGGAGPAIILMHELDGFSKAFIHLALRLSESFTVHAPVFYGGVGEDFSGLIGLARAYFCIRQEFELLRLGKTSQLPAGSEIWQLKLNINTLRVKVLVSLECV
jgi:hypothetical protein